MNTILFLCTGNYYRSRIAEELFNFWAHSAELQWKADSAGLRSDMSKSPNEGPISKHAVRMLEQRGYVISSRDRYPRSVSSRDLEEHDLVVCLHRTEHEPMLQKNFPDHGAEILFWQVPDVQFLQPEKAFDRIQTGVKQLISILSSSQSHLITAD